MLKPIEIPFNKELCQKHTVPVIDMIIENQPVSMIIDTGSKFDILAQSFLDKHGLVKPVIAHTLLQSISGKERTPVKEVSMILSKEITGILRPSIVTATFDEEYGISGQIGMDTLILLDAVIDIKNSKLIINL